MFLKNRIDNTKWENKKDQEPTNLKDGVIKEDGSFAITKLEEVIETQRDRAGKWEQTFI